MATLCPSNPGFLISAERQVLSYPVALSSNTCNCVFTSIFVGTEVACDSVRKHETPGLDQEQN